MESPPIFRPESRVRKSFGRILLYFLLGLLILTGIFVSITYWMQEGSVSGEKIALVEVLGVITDSRDVVDQISRYRRDPSIRGIIVRIDSPGGAVAPSQEIYKEVLKTRKEKKIIASLGSMAASGGYYIASSADYIIANPGTLTGSIGVIFATSNIEELIQKIGLKPQVNKSGKFKAAGSPVRPMTEEEKKLLQSVVDDVHQQFVEAIATARNLPSAEIKRIADGRVFTGRRALELKLVDQLGSLEDSIQWIQLTLKLKDRPRIIQKKQQKSLLEFFLQGLASNSLTQSLTLSPLPALQYLWPFGFTKIR